MIKAIIFDIDGVLADSVDANTDFYQRLLSRYGYSGITKEAVQNVLHATMLDTIRFFAKGASEEEVRAIWEAAKVEPSSPIPYGQPSGSVETLEALKKNYKVGIATSRTESGLQRYFALTKNRDFFDTIVGYDDTENHKPDPEPLLLAAKQLEVSPKECVYVGDAETDRDAAKGAGMHFIAYGPEPMEGVEHTVCSFPELSHTIKVLL